MTPLETALSTAAYRCLFAVVGKTIIEFFYHENSQLFSSVRALPRKHQPALKEVRFNNLDSQHTECRYLYIRRNILLLFK